MHDSGCRNGLRTRRHDGMWYMRVGKWLQCMEKTYQEWIFEVDLAYHVPGLRHALVMKGSQRCIEEPSNSTFLLPQAKKTCTARKITGQFGALTHQGA